MVDNPMNLDNTVECTSDTVIRSTITAFQSKKQLRPSFMDFAFIYYCQLQSLRLLIRHLTESWTNAGPSYNAATQLNQVSVSKYF